jgi:uncharacterized protein
MAPYASNTDGHSAPRSNRGAPQPGAACLLSAAFALLMAAGPARAADPCVDVAQAVAMLKDGDQFQASAQLFASARHGCEDEARALLDRGVALDARDREGATALARAARASKIMLVTLFLERGANVNARAVDGSTPLFYAAESDRGKVVAMLIEHGADPNLAGRAGLTPLDAAAFNNSDAIAKQLLQHGAEINALDNDGKGAMVYAAGRGNTAVVALLLDSGVDVNRRYAHNLTALMWAAGHDASAGSEDVEATVKLLVARGATLALQDDRGKTAAEIARSLGRDRLASLLSP